MNFREELRKVNEEKSKEKSAIEQAVESILRKLLGFWEENNDPKISEGVNLTFTSKGNIVYVMETDKNPLLYDYSLFKEFLVSSEDAQVVLKNLGQQLRNEKFEILPAENGNSFSAIIKP